jgi:hypothetical protein
MRKLPSESFRPSIPALSCTRTVLTYLWNAVRTALWVSVPAVVFIAFRPTTDDPPVLREITHPDMCLACAASSHEARAALDAYLIRIGAIEAPTESDNLSEADPTLGRESARGWGVPLDHDEAS